MIIFGPGFSQMTLALPLTMPGILISLCGSMISVSSVMISIGFFGPKSNGVRLEELPK